MATKKNPSSGPRPSATSTSRPTTNPTTGTAGASSSDVNLPAEPEVTRRAASSNPGREPAHLAAARARRQSAYQEEAMRRESSKSRNVACPPQSTLSSGLKLIGGAGLGAVLMYLLDPDEGEQRRTEWSDKAARAAATSGTALGNFADIAGNVAGNVWDLTTDAGRAMAARAAEAGSAGAAAASGFGANFAERAGDTAHGLHKGARRQMKHARKSTSKWFGQEEEPSYVPETSTVVSAVTALAAGVGLMYLLDPTDGPRRRNTLLGKATRCLNETGDFFRRTGRHLSNRSRGMAHQTGSMFQRDQATDRQVSERIRSRIGHLQQQSTVHVVVMDGRATLTGQCTADDVQPLLTTVQATPGVASIVNLLNVRNENATA